MQPGLPIYQRLTADQPVAASTALVDLGLTTNIFQVSIPPGKTAIIRASLPFSVGASGGFKFQATMSQTPQDYSMSWEAIDGVTASPGAQVAVIQAAQAAFANAWAVAGNHQCNLDGSVKGHATLTSTLTIQFACNSAANAINVLKGATMQVILL